MIGSRGKRTPRNRSWSDYFRPKPSIPKILPEGKSPAPPTLADAPSLGLEGEANPYNVATGIVQIALVHNAWTNCRRAGHGRFAFEVKVLVFSAKQNVGD